MRRAPVRSRLLLCFFILSWSAAFPLRSGEGAVAPLRFAVIGDSGTGDEHQYLIAQRMAEWHGRLPFGLVLMLGDNVYGGAVGLGGGNRKNFEEKFDRPYGELLRRGVVFRATLGNHDMQTRNGRDLVESYERFHIERPEGYYSFTAGTTPDGSPLIEFFVLNTVRLEKNKKDPEQLAWLQQALKASRARWRIVYGHHPLYSTGKRHGADERMRAKVEPLLARGKAQVVFAGHDHIYERFGTQNGTAYFVCGSSGKLRRGNARASNELEAVNDKEHVFMLWEATPEELRFRALNERGEAFDCGAVRGGAVEAVSCPAGTAP